jgi:outer membrane protein assembly factor BamA
MRRLALWLLLAAFCSARAMAQSAPEPSLVVEQLVCRGNASTSCTFILGQVYLAEGDVVDEEELQNAKLRLLWLRNFESVSIYLEKGSARGRARVVVEVVEAKPITTELAYGLFDQDATRGQSLSGRFTHYNLFGSGKIFDARANAISPFSGPTIRQYFARAQYIDPHLFDSKRNFFTVGASYLNGALTQRDGDRFEHFFREQVSYDVTLGRRLWDFSYVTLGYQHRPVINVPSNARQDDEHFETVDTPRNGAMALGFGWNSEDDPYFPTRGSRLDVSVIAPTALARSTTAFYRHNWRWARTVWTAYYQSDDIVGIGFARPIAPSFRADAPRRGRWFSGVSFGGFSIAPNVFDDRGPQGRNVGLNAGVLLETRAFGIVQFQLSYSRKLSP